MIAQHLSMTVTEFFILCPGSIIRRNYVLRRSPLLLMFHCSATSHKLLINCATSISLNIYFIISFTWFSVNLCKLFFQCYLIKFICTFFDTFWHLSACTNNHHVFWHDCHQFQKFFFRNNILGNQSQNFI